jgi:hypothetical protein
VPPIPWPSPGGLSKCKASVSWPEAELATASAVRLCEAHLRAMVEGLGDLSRVLKVAIDDDKAAVYVALGLTLTYHPEQRKVVAEARPPAEIIACATERVGWAVRGGT